MSQVFSTIWHVLLLGVSLAYFGSLAAVTASLGQSALQLHQRGLISLTALSKALQHGGARPQMKKGHPGQAPTRRTEGL